MTVVPRQMLVERQIHYVEIVNYHYFGDADNVTYNDDGNDGTYHNEGGNDDFI